MKKLQKHLTKKKVWAALLVLVAVGVVLFITLGGVEKGKRIYYGYKSRAALSAENKKLGEPLKALGFTKINGGNSVCQYIEKYGYEGRPLDCTTEINSYQVFADEESKLKAVQAAKNLSKTLKQNGWQQGNYEVGQWFQNVLNRVDYNPDAYHSKYFDKTFCVLDFFVAYSNPSSPAVNAVFTCTAPETRPRT